MGRLLQAAVLVMASHAVAGAGPTRKVKVDSTPPGAAVYIDTIENGSACDATPCTINVPLGEHSLIIRLDKYQPELESIDVTKGTRAIPVSVKLKAAFGKIKIIDAPKGATVKVNDEDKGKVGKGPLEIDVPAEPASVVVLLNGKVIAQELVEVEADAEVEVTVSAANAPTTVASTGEGSDDDTSSDGDDTDVDTTADPDADVTKSTEATARAPYLEAGLAMDVGFRRFSYTDGTNTFNNTGDVVLGPAVELWPGRLAGVHLLRNLSLFARFQFAVSHQKVLRESMGMNVDVGASTFWGALEVSVRNKWTFGSFGVEPSAGYVRDQLEFSAATTSVLDMVPSADYKSIRIGARLSYLAKIEPYVSAEGRIVLSGGELANRADKSDVSGYSVAAGVRTNFGPVGVRLQGALAGYSWTYSNTTSTETAPPGATDKVYWLSFLVGYVY